MLRGKIEDEMMDRLPYDNRGKHNYAVTLLLCSLLVFLYARYVCSFSVVYGSSMEDTLMQGTVVTVKKVFFCIDRYDVVTLRTDNGFIAVKRVIGLPGETVSIYGSIVYVNGQPIGGRAGIGDTGTWLLDTDEYFVLGDNRENSYDSRDYGAVNRRDLSGIVKGKR